jgi:two-component system sensor histidine kinase RpfC
VVQSVLPVIRFAASPEAAAEAVEALRQTGIRRPLVVVDTGPDAAMAAAVVRGLLSDDDNTTPVLIAVTDAGQSGPLPEPARSLFLTTLPRPVDRAGVVEALAIAAACNAGSDALSDTVVAMRTDRPRLSILVAEDNRTNQKVISKILDRVGHDVTIVDNGEDALEALHAAEFDLVLMDVNMPVMNGLEATKLYRFGELGHKRVPIIALTADATEAVSRRCEQAGMDGCLTKPIEPAHLVEMIDRLVKPDPDRKSVQVLEQETAASGTAGEYPAIEAHKIEELKRLGGAEFFDDLVQQFLDDSIDVLRDLAQAARGADVNAFREQAHALRSGAANIGARRIYELCLAWRNIDAQTLRAEGTEDVRTLEAEFDRVRAALQPPAIHDVAA